MWWKNPNRWWQADMQRDGWVRILWQCAAFTCCIIAAGIFLVAK